MAALTDRIANSFFVCSNARHTEMKRAVQLRSALGNHGCEFVLLDNIMCIEEWNCGLLLKSQYFVKSYQPGLFYQCFL